MTRGRRRLPAAAKLLLATAAFLLVTAAFLLRHSLDPLYIIIKGYHGFHGYHGHDADRTFVTGHDRFVLHPDNHADRDAYTFKNHWRITSGYRRPDGVLKRVYLVNDAFIGPTIEVRPGDRLIITVENALEDEETVSLHWHGLSMRGANDMDGAAGITQSPIAAGGSFTYDFVIDNDQHGTFWWHAHDGVQRADGLYGGLVIHQTGPRSAVFEEERLLLIGDWYHRSAEDALRFYMHPGAFGLETIPDSILLNGQGHFNCADAVPARPLDCTRPDSQRAINLHSADQIWRVVNVGAYAGFSLSMSQGVMAALAVDGGHRIAGATSKTVGVLHPGERVSLRVEPSSLHRPDAEGLSIMLEEDAFKYQNPALTAKQSFPIFWRDGLLDSEYSPQGVYEQFDVQSAQPLEHQNRGLPQQANQTIVLYTITQKLAILENEPHGFINHTRWMPSQTPLRELQREEWDEYQFVPLIRYNKSSPLWVDVVLNNLDEDSHPFHLHGHDFWVLSQYSSPFNWGSYNPFEDEEPPGGRFDIAQAVKKDTVHVPRRGYAILRFRADNGPGIWMFHCHVLWHQASGMSMAFEVN
ncbi:laccase IV [Lecanosticta acicola]|uniref:Laccase IV n=1 Tax=Lecanosticta acicola TaxID=111012 RepID=A0AAI8Z2W7_9PEZI|nr:laccase IV [Lecanosticta acicola]